VPLLGDIKARNLTRDDIEKAQRAIVAGKTALDEKTGWRGRARVTGGPGAARRAIASLSSCLNWALDRSIITANPAVRVKKPAQGKRERYLSEVEAGQLLDTLAEMERGRALQSVFGDMIRVLLLTGARRNEIMELRWSEVDLERGLISLPPERSKTGAKHIPLSAPAAAIIAARPRSERFVFPSPTRPEKPAVGLPKAWSRVRTRANLEGVRIHDLRHSYASFAAAGGASLHLIGKALGHAQAGTTHRYAHLGTDPVKDMAERIGAKIMGTQTKTSEHETADIVPLPTKISR
jgi:integrase